MTKPSFPRQTQPKQPGSEAEMTPRPETEKTEYRPAGKLVGKVALITGGDSGIGRAVAVAFAREGCEVAFSYLNEHEDADETKRLVEESGARCMALPGDIGSEEHCAELVAAVLKQFGKLSILVNNAAEQHPKESLTEITGKQLERTFRTNVFAMFYLTKAALPHLTEGDCIINTSSVTAYRGSPQLIDYSSTKGAIVSFTRSLSKNLAQQKIRVNAVAPGPIWTPLIPSTFTEEKVEKFGEKVPLERAGQPSEVAPAYVFLASADASYFTGQVLHPNGGEVVNA